MVLYFYDRLFEFHHFFINVLLVFQDLIQDTILHLVLSSQPPLFVIVPQTFLVFITLIVLKSIHQAFWKTSLTIFSWSDWGYRFCEEHHKCEVSFSSRESGDTWYQCDLSLVENDCSKLYFSIATSGPLAGITFLHVTLNCSY